MTSYPVRAYCGPDAIEIRSEGDGMTMAGHFAVFGQDTVINSRYEGHFIERIAPGAFSDTLAARGDKVKVLFDHGSDPSIGNKVLGDIRSVTEDGKGAAFEVGLHDTSYVRDLIPGLRSGAYGASFRFSVPTGGDSWDHPTRSSDTNPDMLPVRTLNKVDLYEFGPVTFPAYDGATAGMRSGTDQFIDGLLSDPVVMARFLGRLTDSKLVEKVLADLPTDGRAATTEDIEPTADATHAQLRRQWLAEHIFNS